MSFVEIQTRRSIPEISSCDRVSDKQNSGKIVFVGVRHANVDPFTNRFIRRKIPTNGEKGKQGAELLHGSFSISWMRMAVSGFISRQFEISTLARRISRNPRLHPHAVMCSCPQFKNDEFQTVSISGHCPAFLSLVVQLTPSWRQRWVRVLAVPYSPCSLRNCIAVNALIR